MYQYYYFDNKEKADSMYEEIVDLVNRSKKRPKRVKVEKIIDKYWGYWNFDKPENTYIYEIKVEYDGNEIVLIEYTHLKKNSKFKKAIPYILIFIGGVLFGTCINIEPKIEDDSEENKEDDSQ